MEAAMSNQQICNMTQSCENTLGSFQCICPGGTQLNMQGECVAMPIPTTTITSATPISSTLSPSYTTITRVSSTPLPTTTPTVLATTIPTAAPKDSSSGLSHRLHAGNS